MARAAKEFLSPSDPSVRGARAPIEGKLMISSSANHARMQAYQSISTKLACLVLGLFSLIVPLAAQTGPIVWTARSLDRIAPDAAAGNVTSVSIAAGKGEYES